MRCKGRSLDPYQGEPARPLSPPSHGRLLSDSPYLCPGNTWRPGTCLYPDTGARAGATSDRRYSRQLKETPGEPPPAAPRLWPPPARPGPEQVCQRGSPPRPWLTSLRSLAAISPLRMAGGKSAAVAGPAGEVGEGWAGVEGHHKVSPETRN